MIYLKKSLPLAILLLMSLAVHGQKSAVYAYGDNGYLKGLELYEKKKYGAARHTFEQYLAQGPETRSEIRSEASYYRAMSAVELHNDDAEFLVYSFINTYPESPHVNDAAFRLADYFYEKNSWASTISWYNRVDRHRLDRAQLSEYYFKKGYAYYMRNDYDGARANFYEILEVESPYQAPAIYYYSHIHYEQENWETALMGFRKIDDDPLFSNIAPYYISQILFMQKKYGEVIDYALPFMDSVSDKRLGEMSKIVGESYFIMGEYAGAIPYLETYRDHAGATTVHDRYQLAFAYYSIGEYGQAMTLFEQISYGDTEIAQSALYHLADCYMQLGEKNKARIAFSKAANMNHDLKIQQDALFNFAKVTFELSYDPFNEAIRAFEQYIRTYPAAENTDEAYNYLVMAYLATRNYALAMESLQKIRIRTEQIDRAHQKVAFYRGLELYKNLRFDEAVDALEVSLQYAQYDPVIAARTHFWLGEAAYRNGDRTAARMYYEQFLENSSAPRQEEYVMCLYSMGYLFFDDENYGRAQEWFNRYLRQAGNNPTATVADVYNRLGDCSFVQTDYARAMDHYDRCIATGLSDVDYAMFQKGFTLGLLDRPGEKVEVLNRLIRQQPNSNFVDDALFEIGRSYVVLNQPDRAQSYYEQLVNEHPNSSYVSKSLNQLGLIYYNGGEYDRALTYYEQVASRYPGTPEADNALNSIKNIYVRSDNVDGYLAFVGGIGQDISLREQDSLSYTAAEMVYMRGECQETVRALEDYLDDFPGGRFLLNAHYYKADCQLKMQQNDEALESLDYIIAQPRNMFTEPALVAASKINFREEDYHRAADNYRKLIEVAEQKNNLSDAQVGLMRCYFELGEYSQAIAAGRDVLQMERIQEEVEREANYKIAKSFYELNEVDFAFDFFRKVAAEVNTREGAESKYMVIEILYDRGEYKTAEEEVYGFIEMNTPHQYWMGMAFLTLSDIYIAMGDEFSAINSLQSLIDYYTIPDDGIIANARQRRAALIEEAESDIAPEPEMNQE